MDAFARLFVIPQASHGLTGTVYTTDGEGKATGAERIPNVWDRVGVLMDWVENNNAPGEEVR